MLNTSIQFAHKLVLNVQIGSFKQTYTSLGSVHYLYFFNIFLKKIIRIESARIGGSKNDGRDVFLGDS